MTVEQSFNDFLRGVYSGCLFLQPVTVLWENHLNWSISYAYIKKFAISIYRMLTWKKNYFLFTCLTLSSQCSLLIPLKTSENQTRFFWYFQGSLKGNTGKKKVEIIYFSLVCNFTLLFIARWFSPKSCLGNYILRTSCLQTGCL